MNCNRLEQSYVTKQIDRIRTSLQKLDDPGASPTGRVVPSEATLTLGTGRVLSMSVMFIDICRFSALPAERPEEQSRILLALNLLFTELTRIAEDYGGTVEKNTGDGLMIYFEDQTGPAAINGSTRAVASALTMLAIHIHLLSPVLRWYDLPALSFRIAIDHGTVTVARLGSPGRFNAIVAIGTSANVASKALSIATEGQIIIGASVSSLLPVDWRLQWVRPISTPSGFVYRLSGMPYPLFLYCGRWRWPGSAQ